MPGGTDPGMRHISLIIALSLWPATLAAEPGMISARTGVTGSHSSAFVVADQGGREILAEGRILVHGSYQAFIVELGQRRDGTRALQMSRASRPGARLDFEPARRTEAFCTGSGACTGLRLGTIFLSQSEFETAVMNGMAVSLSGPGGQFDLSLPQDLFAQARSRAVWLD